jgi:hypothetical protein
MSKGKVFTAQEVQNILSGNKRMFREVIKVQPPTYIKNVNFAGQGTWEWGNSGVYVEEPYQKGQKIFVKESFVDFRSNNSDIFYKSDFEINNLAKIAELKWSPAQQMKQEHSRLTLQIIGIKVERLADISEEDAYKEGVQRTDEWTGCADDLDFTDAFKFSWNATHKKPEEKFEANLWVWVVDFEVVK